MADVQVFVKVDGIAAEAAVPIITDLTRMLAGRLRDAGHSLGSAKVAVVCQACGALINPGQGTLCHGCAGEEALDRLEAVATGTW